MYRRILQNIYDRKGGAQDFFGSMCRHIYIYILYRTHQGRRARECPAAVLTFDRPSATGESDAVCVCVFVSELTPSHHMVVLNM